MGSAVGAFCPSPSLLLSRIRASQRLSPAIPITCAMAHTACRSFRNVHSLLPKAMQQFAVQNRHVSAFPCLIIANQENSRPLQVTLQPRMPLAVNAFYTLRPPASGTLCGDSVSRAPQ